MRATGAWLVATVMVGAPVRGQVADVDAVRETVLAVGQGIEAGDVAALDTLYAPDAWVRVVEGAGVNRGWADYRDHHLQPELDEMQNLRYRYSDVETQVRADVAWATFRYTLSVELGDQHIERIGRGTMVLERRSGQWKVVHSHTSGREPRPGEEI